MLSFFFSSFLIFFYYYFTSACYVGTRCVNVAYYTFAQPMSYTVCAVYTVKRRLELLIHINGKLGWFWLASDDNEDFSGGDMVVAVLGTPHGHQSATQKYHERHRTQHPAKLSANCFSFCLLFRRVALAAQYTTMSKK